MTESIDSIDTEPGTGSRKKKKIIITCIVIFIVLAACAAALVRSFEHKASEEYKAAVKSADIYMKKSNYKRAAVKYLEAIDAKPAEQDAYVRLADVYMKQKESGKAVKILEKGEANAKKKTKIKEKLQYVRYMIHTAVMLMRISFRAQI
ncbi:MAG: tetratricopeptide repeat protein [Anaerovoracaceae bacterium]